MASRCRSGYLTVTDTDRWIQIQPNALHNRLPRIRFLRATLQQPWHKRSAYDCRRKKILYASRHYHTPPCPDPTLPVSIPQLPLHLHRFRPYLSPTHSPPPPRATAAAIPTRSPPAARVSPSAPSLLRRTRATHFHPSPGGDGRGVVGGPVVVGGDLRSPFRLPV
jgi:hypothetical protein